MAVPPTLSWLFAGIMLAVAAFSAARVAVSRRSGEGRRPTHLDVDVDHGVMGIAMAGMFVGALDPLPAAVWEAFFSASAAWFVARIVVSLRPGGHGISHYPTHLVMDIAMLDMYLGAGAGRGHRFFGLPLVLLFALVLLAVFEVDRYSRRPRFQCEPGVASPPPAATASPALSPGLVAASHVAMSIAMAYMLVVLL